MNQQVKNTSTLTHPSDDTPAPPGELKIPSRWRWHYRTLLQLRDQLLQQREDRSAAFHVALERAGADAADLALAQRENFENLAAIATQDAELEEVEAALGRLRHGTYGVCRATGEEISPERLRAIPWTRFSKTAAVQRENAPRQPAMF